MNNKIPTIDKVGAAIILLGIAAAMFFANAHIRHCENHAQHSTTTHDVEGPR
jgi:hypothetical protein